MTQSMDESNLFQALRKYLRRDLVSWHGIPNPVAGEILNWFDPATSGYLQRVDEWQTLLCKGAIKDPSPIWKGLLHFNGWSYDIFNLSCDTIGAIHCVARLFYKFHGLPRKETDFNQVAARLAGNAPKWEVDDPIITGIRHALQGIKPRTLDTLLGKFGPGATAEGFSTFDRWSRIGSIPDVPPSFFRFNSRDQWTPRTIDSVGCTKIAEVPKSLKGNRVISSEPAMRMFLQKAYAKELDAVMHREFKGHVSLHSQERHNENLRRADAATLDLSDASDLVRCGFVSEVLPQSWPVLARIRSAETRFPDGSIVPLGTFAPMGSGVCFPVLTLVSLGILKYCCGSSWYSAYGDDWILPIKHVPHVQQVASYVGLKINEAKSCSTGFYKESCGTELLHIHPSDDDEGAEFLFDVSSIYIREDPSKSDAAKIEELCSRLETRFFPNTAFRIAEMAQCVKHFRHNPRLQRSEVLCRTTSTKQKTARLDGWSGLMRWICQRTPDGDVDDLSRVATEVLGKVSWRFKPCWNFPYLAHWLSTSASCTNPR